MKSSVESLPVIKFLLMVLEQKTIEDQQNILTNDGIHAAIINAGGTPKTTHYPRKNVTAAAAVAGGAGAIAAATLIAAVTDKKIFMEWIQITLATDTASGGVKINFRDGAGGSTLFTVVLSINQPCVSVPILKAGTAATLLEYVGVAAQFAALDDNDTVDMTLSYREV